MEKWDFWFLQIGINIDAQNFNDWILLVMDASGNHKKYVVVYKNVISLRRICYLLGINH
jgi:hypothetical protein